MSEPKILLWDTEISHIISQHYDLWKINVPHSNILHDWFMICGQWKWLDKKRIETVSLLDDMPRFLNNSWDVRDLHIDDYVVVKTLHGVLSEADILVHHNGDKFDVKKFNARALYHGLKPIPNIPTVDTLKEARKVSAISSNSLAYLGEYFGFPAQKRKLKPGTMQKAGLGDVKAIKDVVTYGRGDIPPLEALYYKLRPFMKSHPNLNTFIEGGMLCNCGSGNLQARGYRRTKAGKYQRYQCQDCGSWSSGRKNLIRTPVEIR